METTKYIKWFLEVANQEYSGDIRLFDSNINHKIVY